MNVYLFTTKILKGATISTPVHVAFYDETPNDFEEKKKCKRFVS